MMIANRVGLPEGISELDEIAKEESIHQDVASKAFAYQFAIHQVQYRHLAALAFGFTILRLPYTSQIYYPRYQNTLRFS
jgi:hypothetical protein